PRAVGDIVFGVLALLGAALFMLSVDAVTVGVVVVVMVVTFGARLRSWHGSNVPR
ncbi:hypothetical protein H7I94_25435, partial [Mycobacterium szulgai]|nr:hypothetical protein [Mycobacterium szulgai]MCV7078583.1 hypothetical protein [Mycobacterium szulgai]